MYIYIYPENRSSGVIPVTTFRVGLTLHGDWGDIYAGKPLRFLFDGKNHSFLHFPSTSETNSLTISSHLCWFSSSFWLVTRDNSCDEQTSYGRCWSSIPVFDGWNACLVGWNDVIIIQLVLAKSIFGDLYLVEHIRSWWCAMVKLLNPTCTCWFLETNPSLMVSSMFTAPIEHGYVPRPPPTPHASRATPHAQGPRATTHRAAVRWRDHCRWGLPAMPRICGLCLNWSIITYDNW